MNRQIEPEILDTLPAVDPQALRSRQDLIRLNRLMGHDRILMAFLSRLPNPPRRLVELGAGDGTFLLRLVGKMSAPSGDSRVVLVDRHPCVSDRTRGEYERLGWQLEIAGDDVFDWLADCAAPDTDLMVANLFLHHFSAAQLKSMLELAAGRTSAFAACEPRRNSLSLAAAGLVGLIGCGAVTRHDAVVSVRAGFSGGELSALWPPGGRWELRERPAGVFSHFFSACRREAVMFSKR